MSSYKKYCLLGFIILLGTALVPVFSTQALTCDWEESVWTPGYTNPYCNLISGYTNPECYWNPAYTNPQCYWVSGWTDPYCTWVSGWTDPYCTWVPGYTNPYCNEVPGYWEYNGYWIFVGCPDRPFVMEECYFWYEATPVWIPAHYESCEVPGYWESCEYPAYWIPCEYPGYWLSCEVPGYWESCWVSAYYESCEVPGYWTTQTLSQTCPVDSCSTTNECKKVTSYCGSSGCLNQLVVDNTCTNLCSSGKTCSGGSCVLIINNQPPANQPPAEPSIPDPYKPSGVTWDNCLFEGKSIPTFHWTYSDPDGDPQTAYEIEIDNNAAYQAPKFNHLVNNAATSYALDLTQDDDSDWFTELAWNTTYNWRVRVKDDHGNWSDWSSASRTFKTPKHAYPYPGFSWAPPEPNQNEVVIFTPAQAGVYYLWTVTQGEATFVDSTAPTSQSPHLTFGTTNNAVKLKVTATDDPDYWCESAAQAITAQLPLPEYKEVPPIIWLKNFFSELASLTRFLFLN